MDKATFEEFEYATASLMKMGLAGPGARVLGYLFRSAEDQQTYIEKFMKRLDNVKNSSMRRLAKNDGEALPRLPKAAVFKTPDGATVFVVNNEEARGIAYRQVGRPLYQTVVPRPPV